MSKQLSEAQSKQFLCIVVGFLDDLGLSKSSNAVKAEIREKCPDLEPSADNLQQRDRMNSILEQISKILQPLNEDDPDRPESSDKVGDVTGEDAGYDDDEDGQHLGNELLAADEEDDIVDEREASDRVQIERNQPDNVSPAEENEIVSNELVGDEVESNSKVERSSDPSLLSPSAESKRDFDQEQRDSVEDARHRGNSEQRIDFPIAEDKTKPGLEAQRGFDRSEPRRHDNFRKEEPGDARRGAGSFETRRPGHFDERPLEEIDVKRMDSFEHRRPGNLSNSNDARRVGTDFGRGDGGEPWRGDVPGRRNDSGEPWRGEGSGRRNDGPDSWRGEMAGNRRADIDGRRVESSGQWRSEMQDARRADGPSMRRVENEPRRVENFRGPDASENRRMVDGQAFLRAEGQDQRRPDVAEFRRLEGQDRREVPDARRDGPGGRRIEGQDFSRFSDRRDNHRRFDGPDHNRFEAVESRGVDTLGFRRDNLSENGWQGESSIPRPNLAIPKGRTESNDPRRIGDLPTARMDGPETNRLSATGNRENFRGSPQDWSENRRGQDVRRGPEIGPEPSLGQHQPFRPSEHSEMPGRGVEHVEIGWRGANSDVQHPRAPVESQRLGLNERPLNDLGRMGPKDASIDHQPPVHPVSDRNSFSSTRNLDASRVGGKADIRSEARFVSQNQGVRGDDRFSSTSGKFAGDNLLVNVSASSTDGGRKVTQSQGFRGPDVARDQQRPVVVRDQSYDHPRLSAPNEPVRTNSSDRVGFSERESNFFPGDGMRNSSVSNGSQHSSIVGNQVTQSRSYVGESKVGSSSFNSSNTSDGRVLLKSERSFNTGIQIEQFSQKEHARDFNDAPGFGANQQRPKTVNRDAGNVEPPYEARPPRDVLQHQGAALQRHGESYTGQEPRRFAVSQGTIDQSAGFQHQTGDGARRAQFEHHAGQGFGQAGETLTGPSGVQDRFIQQQREVPLSASPGSKPLVRKPVIPASATADAPILSRQLVNQGLPSPRMVSTSVAAASSTADVGAREHVVTSQSDPRAISHGENQQKKRKADDNASSAEISTSAGRGMAAAVTREIATQKPRVVSLKAITQAHNPEPVNPEPVVQKRFRKHDGSAGTTGNEGNRGNWNGHRGRGGFHGAGSGWRGHGQG